MPQSFEVFKLLLEGVDTCNCTLSCTHNIKQLQGPIMPLSNKNMLQHP